MRASSIKDITRLTQEADEKQLELLERTLAGDERKSVQQALARARKRIEAEKAESARIDELYLFEERLAQGADDQGLIVGLDEVGRGSIAGPLAVGAVVLPRNPRIAGLDDSKRLRPDMREHIADSIRSQALFWHVEYVAASVIDDSGIMFALKQAFQRAIAAIEMQGAPLGTVLLDGNPLHIDEREVSVVKGDATCASIAAASIIAKVERDHLMEDLSRRYPPYGFDANKGYGTQAHRDAIARCGLTDVHRKSFCMEFLQESLF